MSSQSLDVRTSTVAAVAVELTGARWVRTMRLPLGLAVVFRTSPTVDGPAARRSAWDAPLLQSGGCIVTHHYEVMREHVAAAYTELGLDEDATEVDSTRS